MVATGKCEPVRESPKEILGKTKCEQWAMAAFSLSVCEKRNVTPVLAKIAQFFLAETQ